MDRRKLNDEKGTIWSRMQTIWDVAAGENRPMNDAESREYEDLGQKIDSLDSQMAQDVEHERRSKAINDVRRDTRGMGEPTTGDKRFTDGPEYRAIFDKYLRFGAREMDASEVRMLRTGQDPELRALASAPGSAGGFTVPVNFSGQIIESMKWFGGMRAVAEILTTSTGQEIDYPTNDDTGNTGRLVSENVSATATDLTFGQKAIRAYLYSSDIVLVPITLLMDQAVDLESYISKKLGQRLGRIENTHQTTGTGAGQPQGLVTAATVGKTTAAPTAITFGEAIDLEHSIDPAYRNRAIYGARNDAQTQPPTVGYMFSDSILGYLRKLVDGNSRPLWLPGFGSVNQYVPATFNGWPYVINNDMAAASAGAPVALSKHVMFGDFETAFLIREVEGMTIMRLDERYADAFQVAFLGFHRMDSTLKDAGAVKVLAQHA